MLGVARGGEFGAGPYALMWSGGKDSALALQRAKAAGLDVKLLVNFFDAASRRVRFHATRIDLLEAQAAALGIELRAIGTSWPGMDARLTQELGDLKSGGFKGVIFGDIHLADVRAWYEERVIAAGLEHLEPLWGAASRDLLAEFVQSGGRAVVTCVDQTRLDRSWLGRIIDHRFASEIATTGVDECGENGEFHSFAFSGPTFAKAVSWKLGDERSEGSFIQTDVLLDVSA